MRNRIILLIVCFTAGTVVGLYRGSERPDIVITRQIRSCAHYYGSPQFIRCMRSPGLKRLVADAGLRQTMLSLSGLFRSDNKESRTIKSCHEIAHIIGEQAAGSSRSVGSVISECSSLCAGGCIHGALRTWVRANGLLGIESLCIGYTGVQKTSCEHAIGHGISDYTGYDLKQSGDICGRMPNDEARVNCGRGVIMEIFDAPVGDHPVGDIPDDTIEWCNSLESFLKDACYVSVGIRQLKRSGSAPHALDACRQLPVKSRAICIAYLGQFTYFYYYPDVEKIAEAGTASFEDLHTFLDGVLESAASYGRSADAEQICRKLWNSSACADLYARKIQYWHTGQSAFDFMTKLAKDCKVVPGRTAFSACMKRGIAAAPPDLDETKLMAGLDAVSWNTKEFPNRCHDVAHIIGEVGVSRGRTDASFCTGSVCGDGCYHGALEQYVKMGHEMSEIPETFCAAVPGSGRSQNACYHGFGHGAGSVTGSVGAGLAACEQIPSAEFTGACMSGVFMELFQSENPDYRRMPEDFAAYCKGLIGTARSVCMEHAGVYEFSRSKDAHKARDTCYRLPDERIRLCMLKIGGAAFISIRDARDAAEFCTYFGSYRSACMEGILEESAFTDPGATLALQVCREMDSREKAACVETVRSKVTEAYGSEAGKAVSL